MTDEYEKDDDEEYESEQEELSESESDDESSDDSEGANTEGDDTVASWGYEEKKSRFSREVIAGFAAIGVLIAIFCVVVMKKFPGNDEASGSKTVSAPDASLGNPALDPNDPFASGANLGTQSEPGIDGESQIDPFLNDEAGNLGTLTGALAAAGSGNLDSGKALPFPADVSGGATTFEDPFASNSASVDLFANQQEPGVAAGATSKPETSAGMDAADRLKTGDEFGANGLTQTERMPNVIDPFVADRRDVFGASPSGSVDTGNADLFAPTGVPGNPTGVADPLGSVGDSIAGNAFEESGLPDLSGAGRSTTMDSSSDPFGPRVRETADSSSSGDTALAPGEATVTLDNEFGSNTSNSPFGTEAVPLGSDPFGTPTTESPTNDPTTRIAGSEPGGLFDRGPGNSVADGGPRNNSLVDPLSQPDFASGPATGNPFGSPDLLSSGSELGTGASNSPDPFGRNDPSRGSTDSFSSEPFETQNNLASGRSELRSSQPANLFPGSSSGRPAVGTASTETFQPPLTPVTEGPFSNSFETTNTGTYTVKDGDTYWNISKKVYGTAKYFRVLADHNLSTISDPQKMRAGLIVQTPDASFLQRQLTTVSRSAPTGLTGEIESVAGTGSTGPFGSMASTVAPSRTSVGNSQSASEVEPSGILFNEQGYPMFQIGQSDTLTSIASDHLGRASRWKQIFNMNRDQLQSPDKLQIGMLLKLPADASRVPLVDRTSSLR